MKLLYYPDPILTQVSEPVTEFGDELDAFCEDLFRVAAMNDGVGLSAIQVGVPKRIIIIIERGMIAKTLINPEIRETVTERFKFSEGCLSVPGYFEDRERSNSILVRAQTTQGEPVVRWFDGLSAFCIQHEMEHLDGKLFIDDLSPLKKQLVRKKIAKTLKQRKS